MILVYTKIIRVLYKEKEVLQMNISEELVRELQSRIDISYEEAEYFLKRSRGNIDLALEMIHNKRSSSSEKAKTGLQQILTNLFEYRFIMMKKDEVFVNIPFAFILLFLLFDGLYENVFFMLVIIVIALALEIEVKIKKKEVMPPYKENRQNTKENKYETKPESKDETKYPINGTQADKNKDDSYEIIIEE